MKKVLKSSHGITLIALIITIIVLIILAAISISMLSSQDGILNKTTTAKESNKKAAIEEKLKLAVQSSMMNENGEVSKDELKTELDKQFGTEKYEFNSNRMIITIDEISYAINNGEVKEIKIKDMTTEYSCEQEQELKQKGMESYYGADVITKCREILNANAQEVTVYEIKEIITNDYNKKDGEINAKIRFAALPKVGQKIAIVVRTEINGNISFYVIEGTIIEEIETENGVFRRARYTSFTLSPEIMSEMQKGKNTVSCITIK